MSAAVCLLTEEHLLCSLCLDVFTDPVTIPCGHNFCKVCITQHWDNNIQCHCPTCKKQFNSRLDLQVNVFISKMASHFKRSAGKRYSHVAKLGEVPCDVCTETKMRALKSCLVCLSSYCEAHLKPHLTVPRLRLHQLTCPMDNLEARMCTIHEKPLELFCRTDQTCVCMLCPVMDHKSHDIALLKVEFESKRAELDKRKDDIQQMIQERRMKVLDIKRAVKLSKEASHREIADGVKVFSALRQSLIRAQAELTETIEERQKLAEKRARGFIQELEEQISELVRRQAEVEQISISKDHLHFLQSYSTLKSSALTQDWTAVSVNLPSHEGTVKSAVNQLQEELSKEMKKLLLDAELHRVRQFAVDVTLDPNTAHPALILSDDGKQVRHGVARNYVPENPERFNPCCCVITKQCFSSGRFYFEIQVKDKTRWTLGVAEQSTRRKGIITLSPENGQWTVWLKNGNEYAALVGSPRQLALNSKPKNVGVFVDYNEGLVSFYDGDTADVLYSFTGCSFSGKLYPFLCPGLSNNGKNSAPLIIVNHTDFKSSFIYTKDSENKV